MGGGEASQRQIATFTKVTTGAAGGGVYAAARPTITVADHTLKADVEVSAGRRATSVSGTVDSFVQDPGGGSCDDYAKFTARR